MSEEKELFEKYLEEPVGFWGTFKKAKTWILIITALVGLYGIYAMYRYMAVEKMDPQEVKDSIEIVLLDTKWVEKEVTDHNVKIVPSITFKVKNVGKRALHRVNFEALFEFEETGKNHSDGVAQACSEPLPPGQTGDEVFIRSFYGYSGSSKRSFLENKANWKKMRVKLFAKTKGSGPVQVGEIYPIKQVIEGMEDEDLQSNEEKERLAKNTQKLAQSLQVVWQDSRWLDKKVTQGKVVIVPSIEIKVKNVSGQPVEGLIFKGMFLFADSGDWLTDGLTPPLSKALAPGTTGEEILIKGEFGYEGSSRGAFIDNRESWRSVKVKLFARTPDSDYALLGTFPIKREIRGLKLKYRIKQKN